MKMTLIILALILIVSLWMTGRSDWHLNRNKHNKSPEGRLKQLKGKLYEDKAGLIWELQPSIKNKFHQPASGEEIQLVEQPYPNIDRKLNPNADEMLTFDPKNPNLKFLSKTGNGRSYEAILQPNGKYLKEGAKKGTYNYGHPSGFFGSTKHVFMDVIPHFINSKYGS
jgi:hypothetical protein